MRFKHIWLVFSWLGMLLVGCTSLGEKGKESFPGLLTVDPVTQTSIELLSPTNLQFFSSLVIPVQVSLSTLSNVDSLLFLWCPGEKTVTNLIGIDIGKNGSITISTNLLLSQEGTYYFWVKAIVSGGYTIPSRPILIQAYTNVAKVAAPLFSPLPGESANPLSLSLSSATEGSTIFWTTNNWKSIHSGVSPLSLPLGFGNYEVKAYATKYGYLQSDTVVGSYTIRVAPPEVSPGSGSYTSNQTLSFSSSTREASFVWTTNNWITSSSASLVLPSGWHIVKAYATKDGFLSLTNVWEYSISSSGVATPIFVPQEGTYESATLVTATTSTENADIYLSTNGISWIKTNQILLPAGTWVLRGYAEKTGNQSLTNQKTYTINETQVASPQFMPIGGTYPTNITVTLSCATSGATIFWSTNNGASWQNSSSLSLSGGTFLLQAYATKSGLSPSLTNTVSYTIEDTQAPIPGGSIQVSNIQNSSAVVYWPAASDNSTSQAYLRYLLVYATNASLIDTLLEVTNASSNVSQRGWTENMTSATISSLLENTTYYVNVAVKDNSGNTALYTSTPLSFTTSSASQPNGLFIIIFSNWNTTRTLYLPGDHNNWDPNSVTLSHTAGSTSQITFSNTIVTNIISRGSSSTAIEFKVINNANWVDQWVFTSWTKVGPITLYDSGKQIAVTCDNNDVVRVLFDVGNSTITATVEARP
ncbi:MAG: fibronectin type III domain-containing protein [Brevinematales bacterium]|nr:fibronectin type III domain-containing protein [Brevinematales bacterium]